MTSPPARWSRRRVLGAGLAATAVAAIPTALWARPAPTVRTLSLHHLHTGEREAITYYIEGRYEPDALKAINHLLRDFRTGDVHPIEPDLLDWLHTLHTELHAGGPFEVISGYRSPGTNAALHQASRGVAVRSLHMKGAAIDVRLPDRALKDLRQAAYAGQRGGVGYYPADGFVHLDVGRVRRW